MRNHRRRRNSTTTHLGPQSPRSNLGHSSTFAHYRTRIVGAYIHGCHYATASEVDHRVDRVLAQLDNVSLADSSIVAFISDHGGWLGEHYRA